MNNNLKIVAIGLVLMLNGVLGAFMSKSIREGNTAWYWTYIVSVISASVYAYQLKAKVMPLTVASVFQTFFFHSAWYITAFFILNNELQHHKLIGLLFAFTGMLIMSV